MQNSVEGKLSSGSIFLCYSSGDKEHVVRLCSKLREHTELKRLGFRPWRDKDDLKGGQDWELEVERWLRTSDIVLICLSKSAVEKEGYFQKEIKIAVEVDKEKPDGTIYIIPVLLESCEIPPRLKSKHWINLFDNDGFDKLIDAIKLKAENPQRIQQPSVALTNRSNGGAFLAVPDDKSAKIAAASFHPNLKMDLTDRFIGEGVDEFGKRHQSISGSIILTNRGNLPLKIECVAMKAVYDANRLPIQKMIKTLQTVVPPGEIAEFRHLIIEVPLGGTEASYEQIAQVHCSDLAGVSKHTFWISTRLKQLLNHSMGYQPM